MSLRQMMIIFVFSLPLLLAACIPTPTPTNNSTPMNTLTPTNTPTPTPTSTPTPVPQARISEPVDNQHIPPNVKVIVEYKNIPHDRYLWVAVRVPNVQPPASEPPLTRWIYPQLQRGKMPSQPEGTGTFVVDATFGGGSEDSGAPFNVLVLLVDANAQGSFTEYAERCGLAPDTCRGMKLPDTGVEILDFNTVIRQ